MASFRFPFRGLRSEFARAAATSAWAELGQHLDRNFDELERSAGGWRSIGAAGEPAFQNAWANYGAFGHIDAAFFKHALTDVVYVRGLVKAGTTGAPAFTLPAGYRPPAIYLHPAFGHTGTAEALYRVDVEADGDLIIRGATAPAYVDINVWFRTT